MSETMDFKDMVKGLPQATSATGMKVMMSDTQGAVSLLPIQSLMVVDLNGKEPADTELDVKEFHTKYMKGLPVGTMLTDRRFQHTSRWYVKISDTVKLHVQYYLFVITKNAGSIGQAWSYISFLAFPILYGDGIYKVDLTADNSTATFTVKYSKVGLTSVTLT